MSDLSNPCNRCGTSKDGAGELCVPCFSELSRPCPECTYRTAGGMLTIRSERSIGRKPIPVDCAHCNNERWVTLPYEPFVPPAKRPSKAAKPR